MLTQTKDCSGDKTTTHSDAIAAIMAPSANSVEPCCRIGTSYEEILSRGEASRAHRHPGQQLSRHVSSACRCRMHDVMIGPELLCHSCELHRTIA
jgi:hypothetical protein